MSTITVHLSNADDPLTFQSDRLPWQYRTMLVVRPIDRPLAYIPLDMVTFWEADEMSVAS